MDISTLQRQVDQVMDTLRQQGVSDDIIQQKRAEISEAIKSGAYQSAKQLPHFVQRLYEGLTAVNAYQHFRLPGRDRIVQDRREQPKGTPAADAKGKEGEKTKEAESKEKPKADTPKGKEEEKKEATERKSAGRLEKGEGKEKKSGVGGALKTLEGEAARSRMEKMFTAFEKLVVARFEEGMKLVRELAAGEKRFSPKNEADWKAFFANFFNRTVAKKVSLADIREFLFRGLVLKGNKGVVISDMILANGRVEKFVRFSVFARALEQLKKLAPGDQFAQQVLSELSGEELVYLALAASRGRELAASKQAAQGKFLDGQIEARVAEALGIAIEGQSNEKERILKRRGKAFSSLGDFGNREFWEEQPYRFVPWWHWGNLQRPGKGRWTTATFYGSLLAVALIGIGVMTLRLLR